MSDTPKAVIHKIAHKAALDSLNHGAPGISPDMRNAIAASIAIKVAAQIIDLVGIPPAGKPGDVKP